MPTPFQNEILAALRNRADKLNEVSATYAEIAADLGDGSSAGEVHQAMLQLKDAGYFSQRHFESDMFNVTLA